MSKGHFILYNSNEKNFTSMGVLVLDNYIMNTTIKETMNENYTFEFEMFNSVAHLVGPRMYIKAPTRKGDELFRVRIIEKDMNNYGATYFYCTQVFFCDMEDNFIENLELSNVTGYAALNSMDTSTQYPHKFTFYSDISEKNSTIILRKNFVSALIGDSEYSFVNTWGGELEVNKFSVKMMSKIGKDRGVRIRYRKNLIGLNAKTDYSSYCTRIMPVGYDNITMPEKYVDSEKIDPNHPIIRVVEFSDIKVKSNEEDEEGYATIEEAENALREAAQKLFKEGKIDEPESTYEIEFQELSSTIEYHDDYAVLENIFLGDTVEVYHEDLDVSVSTRCVSYEYDPKTDRYISITLGNVISKFSSSSVKNQETILDKIESNEKDYQGKLDDAVEKLTNMINTGLTGHVVITDNEIMIMDTTDKDTAVEVWRYNINGFGYSNTGYNGPFIGLTKDGKLLVTEATTNKFTAALINAGILQSVDGTSWFNLDSGTFSWANGAIAYDGNKLTIKVGDQSIDDILDAALNVLVNREHQIIILDEDGTPSYDGNYEFEFTTYKMGTTIEVASVIKSATPSDDNVSVTFDPAGTTINLVIDTNRQFTAMEGYVDVVVETRYHDVEKRITWSAITDVVDASFVKILPSCNIFSMKYSDSSYSPSKIILTPLLNRCEFSSWSYSYEGTEWTTIVSGKNGLTINKGKLIISNSSELFSDNNNSVAFKIDCTEGASDVTTIARVRDGERGPQGVPGKSGSTYYTWIRYADDANGNGISNNPTGKKYIGLAYNKTTPTESNKASDYKWSLITGKDGLPGEKGDDGTTYYTWIAYSDNPNGSPMYQTPTEKTKYIGIATNQLTSVEGTDPSVYTWSQFRGNDGATPNFNLVTNSAFIDGSTGWTFRNAELDPSKNKDGHPCYKVSCSGATKATWSGGRNSNVPSNPTSYKAGDTITYSCYYYIEDLSTFDLSINLEIKGIPEGATKESQISNVRPPLDQLVVGAWTRLYRTVTLEENFDKCSIRGDVIQNGTAWFTDFKMELGSNVTPWLPTVAELEGPQGVEGPAGKDGVTYYTWIKYADDAKGTGISNDPTGKTYIGFAYNKTTSVESDIPSDYTWSLIKGTDGIPGKKGDDGKTYYTWIKYSDNSDGTGMYDTPKDTTKYIGIAVNQTTSKESTDKTKYTWSLFRGNDGKGISGVVNYYLATSSKSGVTTSTSGWSTDIPTMTSTKKYLWNYEKITYTDGSKTTTVPLIIGVYGDKGATGNAGKGIKSITEYYLATSSKSGITTSTEGWSTTIPTITSTNKYLWNYEVIAYTDNTSTTTDPKIIGAYGDKGSTGTSATNVILGNESHTFAAQSNGHAVAAKTNTTVIGYLGATQKACTIGTISGLPTGMTATINNNNTTSASIDIAVTSSMTTKQGILTIPVTCNKITFNKIFSYSLSLDGKPAPSARIVASSNSFLSSDGGKTYSPNSIKLSFSLVECTYSKWQYNTDGGSSWTNVTSGSKGFTINSDNTLSITVASALFGSLSGTVHIKLLTSNSKAYDVITINKLVQVEDIGNQLSDIKSEITQTNNQWKAAFTTGNANNLLYDGDFKLGTDNWIAEDGATITTGKSTAFPFYDNEKFMKIVCPGAARYKYDLELKPDTDYVYEAWVYIYSAKTVTGERCPLDFWLWTGDIPLDKRSSLCEIKEYNNSRVSKKFAHLYIHFKTTNSPTTVVKWRGFISAYTPTSGTSWLGVREVSLREASMPGAWQPNANEVVTGSTIINQNGVKVEHSEAGTYTQMDSTGFSIRDSDTDEVFAWLSSKEQWTELKVDKVFAGNIENVYEGDSNLYVDHSATLAGDGTSDKPFNSFNQLSNHLMTNPVINKDIFIVVRDPGFTINEPLYLERLKGTGFIKITLEGTLVIANPGSGQYCIRLHQIPKWVWIVSGREFGSSTTGAVLQDGGNGDGHGIYATDVERLEIDALTIACKNWGIHTERTHLYTWHVDFGKCYCAVELDCMSQYYSSDDVGSCVDFCRIKSGSFAYWGYDGGTPHRPKGNVRRINGMYYDGGIILTPTDSPRFPTSNPSVPSTSGQIFTYTYDWTSHKTYQYQWSNWGDSDCKQGAWGYGLRGGHMFFDLSTLRSQMTGTVQDGNTITLTRASSGGESGGADVYINGSSCSSASGTPIYGGQILLGTLAWGETKTFNLPKAIVQGLVSGTYNSLAVYVNSTASNCYLNIVNASITLKTKK